MNLYENFMRAAPLTSHELWHQSVVDRFRHVVGPVLQGGLHLTRHPVGGVEQGLPHWGLQQGPKGGALPQGERLGCWREEKVNARIMLNSLTLIWVFNKDTDLLSLTQTY